MKVLKGRWGPYIQFGKNIKIPKDKDPLELTYQDCVKLDQASEGTNKGRGNRFAKKTVEEKNRHHLR